MRVIAGTAKGTQLRAPSSDGTRPISDRGKEALFSILMPRLQGARFLDLFAGTGGVAIEALSRGAAHALCVELDRRALDDLEHNLAKARVADRAEVVQGDAFAVLQRGTAEPYDIVFVAPPQWKALWDRAILTLDTRPEWLAPGGLVVVQCDPQEVREQQLEHLHEIDLRTYGGVAFIFYGSLVV
ncbi:MAG TPA: 16S rRNA (guanine(966)-N(2))-methyltransferase RsmD [Solirubrobacteraceae bacterium]|nr:16S rRNA (guanine(966)-N(2))-methyltransferase RsmD [Solirubrobacteraceae bacterium]